MCGLVGVAGKSTGAIDKMFRTLLILDTVRGEHSTGVLLVDAHGDTSIHKAVGSPYELFDSRKYHADLIFANNVMMGHNRYATKGIINKRNAHPFEHDHIIGAHNGTLTTQHLLDDHKEYAVDSDNVFHHMSLNGLEDTVSKLGGAFALSWYDSIEGTINFIRNDVRPLYFCYGEDFKSVMWASEQWMLLVAADKAGVKIGAIEEVPVFTHHSLVIPNMATSKYPILGHFTTKEVKGYKAPAKKSKNVSYLHSRTQKTTGTSTLVTGKTTSPSNSEPNFFHMLNKFVDFTVKGVSAHYKHMVEVELVDHKTTRARVLCKSNSKIYKELMGAEDGQVFQGQISRVNKSSAWTINIKQSTIDEVDFDIMDEGDAEAGKYPVGYPATYVSLSEWETAVEQGCSWCSDVPQNAMFDAFELVWFSKDEHVCERCSHDAEIKKYLHL